MGYTVIEKIFKNHLINKDDEVAPGNIVWIKIDYKTARDFGGANVVNNLENFLEGDFLEDKENTMFTMDCVVPAKTIPYAINQHRIRQFARKNNLKVYDVNSGIGSHILINNYVKSGMTAVGTDSHFNIMGAVSCFGQGMGDVDIAYIFKTGKTWFEVPSSVKITINGKRKENITAKDIVLFLLENFGSRKLLGKSVELYGEEIEKLKLHERVTIASMATEMGAISIMIPIKGLEEYEGFDVSADKDAVYEEEFVLDFKDLQEPRLAAPPYPHNIKKIEELRGKELDTVFIGSCTNGRFEDIAEVAEIVKGKQIKTNGYVVPATKEVYGKMIETGVLATLFNAGFLISNPGCGGCATGQIGMTGNNEIIISTSNRNFKGKQGNGEVFLASPRIAAFSALKGFFDDK